MPGQLSELKPYSYAVLVSDKPLSSFDIEAMPVEDFTMANGEITENVTQIEASGTDASGAAYTTNNTQSSSVTATWLPIGIGNRQTPPDLRRGDQVMLYRFGDADKYYWTSLRTDLSLRRLETAIYAYSAFPHGDQQYTPGPENCYIFGISAHQKRIFLTTSQANGEAYKYQIELDLENGVFSIWDNIDNAIVFDSENHHIRIQNADGSFLELDKNVFNLKAAEQINMETEAYTLKATTIKENGETREYEGTQDTVKANQTVAGDWNTTEGAHGSGNATSAGNFHTVGKMTADAGMQTSRLDADVVHANSYENLP